MTQIQFNLMNFPFGEQLTDLFGRYSDDYEYTPEGIFRLVIPPQCPECGTLMDHNGSNSQTKRWLGIVKIGKYSCPKCHNRDGLDLPQINLSLIVDKDLGIPVMYPTSRR
jgi:hypothetical protein